MKYNLLFFILLVSLYLHGQDNKLNSDDINSLFEVTLDSIERVITKNEWSIDTSYYIHYRVKNISNNTLVYITNSCFYYNHYRIKIEDVTYEVNEKGGCSMNMITPYELSKEESFSRKEWITSDFNFFLKTKVNIELVIPIVKDKNNDYRVDGRSFVEDEQELIFQGQVTFIETHKDYPKQKKKFRFKTKKRIKKSKKI